MGKLKWTKKIAINTAGNDFAQFRELAVNLLGAKPIVNLDGVSAFSLQDGTLLELYTNHGGFPEYLFKDGKIALGFKVENLETARQFALDQGFAALSDIVAICPTLHYCHLRSTDGTVVGLYQEGKTA